VAHACELLVAERLLLRAAEDDLLEEARLGDGDVTNMADLDARVDVDARARVLGLTAELEAALSFHWGTGGALH
jgi:hypothetical protein